MAHIGQATNNSHLFWYNDIIGRLILTDIWRNLRKSPMDDNQLLIHPDEVDLASILFEERGYLVAI